MRVGEIDTEDISVVVQGPIVKNLDYYSNGWTNECLKRVRRQFQGAEIILSTWKGSDVSGLDYDILVENDDPGSFVSLITQEGDKVYYNLNRQICSTIGGVRRATRKFILKMRTDTIFKSNELLYYFGKYRHCTDKFKIFKERVITFFAQHPHRTKRVFLISDYLHFGLREDIRLIWDITLAPEPETSQWFRSHPKPKAPIGLDALHSFRFAPEQYIWLNVVNKAAPLQLEHIYDYTIEKGNLTDLFIANNIVLIDIDQSGVEVLKFFGNKLTGESDMSFANMPKWLKVLKRWASHDLFTYNHRNWVALYEKYCCKKNTFPDVFRDILMIRVLYLYHYLKTFYKYLKHAHR